MENGIVRDVWGESPTGEQASHSLPGRPVKNPCPSVWMSRQPELPDPGDVSEGSSLEYSPAMLTSLFDNLEQLWKDMYAQKKRIEEYRQSLLESEGHLTEAQTDVQRSPLQPDSDPTKPEGWQRHEHHRRKPRKPVRSAARNDPSFRGVSLYMKTKIHDGDSKLLIMSTFTSKKPFRSMSSRVRRNSGGTCDSCSDSEDNSHISVEQGMFTISGKLPWRYKYASFGGKACASCTTPNTPLWRDAEDGTPLCNACGIRYKKYRVRCSCCWFVPKKNGISYPHCPRCGALLTISSCRRSRRY